MRKKNFDEIAKEKFKFLELDFKCRLVVCQKKDWGYTLIYLNKTTGIKISYEFQQAYIFIMLYKLIDGNLIENPTNIKKDTILYGYGLDDIIIYHNPCALIKPAYQYSEDSEYYDEKEGLKVYISAFANNLKEYASDILSGDFKIFDKIDKIIKERIGL